jgi:hypothetical protein
MCVCFVYVIPRNSNAAFALALEIELQFLTKNFHFSLTNGEVCCPMQVVYPTNC